MLILSGSNAWTGLGAAASLHYHHFPYVVGRELSRISSHGGLYVFLSLGILFEAGPGPTFGWQHGRAQNSHRCCRTPFGHFAVSTALPQKRQKVPSTGFQSILDMRPLVLAQAHTCTRIFIPVDIEWHLAKKNGGPKTRTTSSYFERAVNLGSPKRRTENSHHKFILRTGSQPLGHRRDGHKTRTTSSYFERALNLWVAEGADPTFSSTVCTPEG